jgi:asparagine synthase (glutamine-hydrolysing)
MCGIAGIVTYTAIEHLRERVQRMTDAQLHRGPDDAGVLCLTHPHENVSVMLGSRRLAILDLSAAGHQPLANEDRSVWVVFNGEIYNFRELRNELISLGHRFHSHTDTEILVHGYESWGIEGLLSRLNGMFAFALWDNNHKRLLVSRDRLGEKPVYYFWTGKTFAFASELRALMASGLIERHLNPAATMAYLRMGSVPAPLTMMKNVYALLPGHSIVLEKETLELTRYWRLDFIEDSAIGHDEAAEEVSRLLEDAIRIRLISDVPVGVFLSGGLDSSSVVSFARKILHGPLRTYSMVFREDGFDEGPWAQQVARTFHTEHIAGEATAKDIREHLPELVAAIDQPSVDGINTYYVSQLARSNGTTVALSGIGGDELFGGYPTFRTVPRLMKLSRILSPLGRFRSQAAFVARGLPHSSSLDKLLESSLDPRSFEAAYMAMRGLFSTAEAAAILHHDFAAMACPAFDLLSYLSACRVHTQSPGNGVSALELRTYMHNQLLRDADVMSMAHSLEVRAPLLDHRLVEFLARVPASVKFDGRPKSLLIRALLGKLPLGILQRPKRGFHFPFEIWLTLDLRSSIEEVLSGSSLVGIFDSKGVNSLWQRFLARRVHWSRIWSLVVLQMWLQQFGMH